MSTGTAVVGMLQLQASLSRTFREKQRAAKVTCCEFFSHLIILLLLIYGHSLADISFKPAEHYTTIRLAVPLESEEDFLNIVDGGYCVFISYMIIIISYSKDLFLLQVQFLRYL